MTNKARAGWLIACAATVAGCLLGQSQDAATDGSRIALGKEIAPVPLNIQGKDASQIYLGSFLVNAGGGCNDCHSCPSYKGVNPFQVGGKALGSIHTPGPVNAANYLAGGVAFGPFVSYNLTPDSSGLPGGMTFNKFLGAIRDGTGAFTGAILQVMPWPVYRHMDTRDLGAIYAYLSALPPAQPGTCTGSGETGP